MRISIMVLSIYTIDIDSTIDIDRPIDSIDIPISITGQLIIDMCDTDVIHMSHLHVCAHEADIPIRR